MREYELAILLHPDLEIDLDKPLKKIEKIITDNGGQVLSQENWGKRKTAYPIGKNNFAIYLFYRVKLDGDKIGEIENSLQISEEVIRYLTVKAEELPQKTEKESKSSKKPDDEISKEDDKPDKEDK